MNNITLIGSSHIAQESVDQVKATIEEKKPEIVAIELDKSRFLALQSKKKTKLSMRMIPRIGVKGYLFALLAGWAEKKLGEFVEVSPGTEMLTAAKCAKKEGALLAFIDQHIEITLKRLSKELTWREKLRFAKETIKAVVFKKVDLPFDLKTFDLTKVPSEKIITAIVKKTKMDYPSIYKVLIDERNKIMARKLVILHKKFPEKKIVAVVGAGHVDGMKKLMQEYMKTVEVMH